MALPKQLIDIDTIYFEPVIEEYARGREILANYPDAKCIPVASHWKIPSLHGNEGSAEDWLRIKRNVLVLGTKKSMSFRPNGRSAHLSHPQRRTAAPWPALTAMFLGGRATPIQ